MLSIGKDYVVIGEMMWVKVEFCGRLKERVAGWRRVRNYHGFSVSYDDNHTRHFTVDRGSVVIRRGLYHADGEPPLYYRWDYAHALSDSEIPQGITEWQQNLKRNE